MQIGSPQSSCMNNAFAENLDASCPATTTNNAVGSLTSDLPKCSEKLSAGKPSLKSRLLTLFQSTTQVPATFKWNPENQFIICADKWDGVIIRGSKAYRNLRNVPDSNYLTADSSLETKALRQLNLQSRLTMHGHGLPSKFVMANIYGAATPVGPAILAKFLFDAGLRQVGVLKFKSCNIGKENFLEELLQNFDKRNIKVGYLSAPTGVLISSGIPLTIAGKRFCFPLTLGPRDTVDSYYVAEKYRLKTVKGNVDVAFPGTRYDLPPRLPGATE